MNRILLLLLLLCPLALRAEEAAMEDKDVYYAPDVAEDAAAETPTASVALPQGAYVSKARLSVFDNVLNTLLQFVSHWRA